MRFGYLIGVVVLVVSVFLAGLVAAKAFSSKDRPAVDLRPADRKAFEPRSRYIGAAYLKREVSVFTPHWAERGEFEDEDGARFHGRSASLAALSTHFSRRPQAKREIVRESVRFLYDGTAVEEGRVRTTGADLLPSSASYRIVYIWEGGDWAVSLFQIRTSPEDSLSDFEWLIGEWRSEPDGAEEETTTIATFAMDPGGSFLVGEFTAKIGEKATPLGTIRIGVEPRSNRFKSWRFDPDGGRREGAWRRDGDHWVVDSLGVQGDGTASSEVETLSRPREDRIDWRILKRSAAEKPLPVPPSMVLKRVAQAR